MEDGGTPSPSERVKGPQLFKTKNKLKIMTQENEKLLLKDLCARLPYGVKVKTPYNNSAQLIGIIKREGYQKGAKYIDAVTDKCTYPIRYIEPYLRPMSSMTEEEKKEYKHFVAFSGSPIGSSDFLDWLNKHHFDYRGLIPQGLAIEVTEKNNPYKK